MGTDSCEVVEPLPDPRSFKVHRRLCTELRRLVGRVLRIFPQIEETRPRSSSGIAALVLLTSTLDKAKQLLQNWADSSILYLAMTGESILSKCQKARKSLEKSLVQIQDIVPVMLAAEISRIIDDLRCVTFSLDSVDEEAGRVMRELLQQGPPTSDNDSKENSDIKSLLFVAARLNITSATTIIIEIRSIKKLLQKLGPKEEDKKMILKNLLYLLITHRKSIVGEQMEVYSRPEEPATTENSGRDSLSSNHVKSEPYLSHDHYGTPATELGRVAPPEEYTCPISLRLIYDPVVIASGVTYERMWIQKWFDEGNVICPKTKKELSHMSLTPNVALKELISKWCKANGVSIPNPIRQVEDIRSWEASVTSIRSFGSSMNGLNLPMDISNMSLGSLDNSYNSDSSLVKASQGLNPKLVKTRGGSRGQKSDSQIHDTYLTPLSKLHERQWDSQCQVVEDMKIDFKRNYQAFSSMSSSENLIDPLVRFLKTAYDKHDTKALRGGSQLLLEFTKCCRNGVTNLSEDTCSVLASLLESGVIGEALAILEVLSNHWSDKANIAASSALAAVSKILDSANKEYHRKAIRIMCNFSSNTSLCSYMVSIGCISKLLPFFEDKFLSRDCILLLKNLFDTESGRVSVVETKGCMSCVVEILKSGTDEEKEPALAIVLSLCSQRLDYCELVMHEGIIPYLVNISNLGNDSTKAKALELLRLLRDVEYEDCFEPNPNNSRDCNEHFEEKKPPKKPTFFKKLSQLGKSSPVASKNKR
ncbi:U-box domain-containing protein 5-like [Vicia villosa]|uniref:U-box domain-containing protein 5-like n=1 Tax=Vicia villosa TaxID=3911 RepID=UPI00273B309A|nr:U-box domain-containing protein 5-like [Vicia villosa]